MYRFVDISFFKVLLILEMNYCKIEEIQTDERYRIHFICIKWSSFRYLSTYVPLKANYCKLENDKYFEICRKIIISTPSSIPLTHQITIIYCKVKKTNTRCISKYNTLKQDINCIPTDYHFQNLSQDRRSYRHKSTD